MVSNSTNQTDRKVIPLGALSEPVSSHWSWWHAFRGLAWCEWFAHSRLLLIFLALWLACIWVLPLYASPAWILIFGPFFAMLAGPVFGGSDTSEGCEEFTLALPPTRAERYLARLVVGGGALLLLTAMDLLALGLDLSQTLAKLYVGSGLIQPRPIIQSGLLYGLVAVVPWAVFACSFVMSSLTHSRAMLLSAPFWASLLVLGTLHLGLWYEEYLWGNFNGWLCCPTLALLSIAVLWGGLAGYRRKEVGSSAAPIAIPARWWVWLALSVGALVSALTLGASLARHFLQLLG